MEGDNIEFKKGDMVLQQQGVRRVDGREANSLSFWNSGAGGLGGGMTWHSSKMLRWTCFTEFITQFICTSLTTAKLKILQLQEQGI